MINWLGFKVSGNNFNLISTSTLKYISEPPQTLKRILPTISFIKEQPEIGDAKMVSCILYFIIFQKITGN